MLENGLDGKLPWLTIKDFDEFSAIIRDLLEQLHASLKISTNKTNQWRCVQSLAQTNDTSEEKHMDKNMPCMMRLYKGIK